MSAADNQWLFRKEDLYRTPSQTMGGSTFSEEKEARAKGVTFIVAVGMHLKLYARSMLPTTVSK